MNRPDRFAMTERVLRQVALGVTTLPAALGEMWDAGREAERFDLLLMAKAEREAKRTRRSAGRRTRT